ncbi:1-aminocyclopropane-1-carboxylate deaminase [[Emmonsia] crescens]|uniref:1-aminocyclopropane-1-carboxylate deaminase n=1 Tax=[Emmonsia] crescens TaxID=73230 RepID=A0A0G2J6S0_9EURO|nr:1-aminocyclopropane-1-carboxylate deaminase [Emmonsia crescens UAMH 3008]
MDNSIYEDQKLQNGNNVSPRHIRLNTPLPTAPRPIPYPLTAHITANLGNNKVAIYAERDDLNSALAYGGNKTRKLEYLVADALDQGCDTLVSIGGLQSNHTRQVAAVAARTGLRARLVQEHWVDWEDPGYETVGNIQLSRLMGVDVRLDKSGFGIEHKPTATRLVEECKAKGICHIISPQAHRIIRWAV